MRAVSFAKVKGFALRRVLSAFYLSVKFKFISRSRFLRLYFQISQKQLVKLKQILKLGAAIAVCLNLANAKSLEQIKKDGVITIATEGVYSPFRFIMKKTS